MTRRTLRFLYLSEAVADVRRLHAVGYDRVGNWSLAENLDHPNRAMRLACVVSLFLLLFAAAMSNHTAVIVILGLYTVVGSFWLVLAYRTGLKAVFVAPERTVAIEMLAERQRIPWAGLVLLILAVAGGVALAVVGPKRAAFALGELMPTSGGTGQTDPFARSGVCDGPEETAGDDGKAAGMVASNRGFMKSSFQGVNRGRFPRTRFK